MDFWVFCLSFLRISQTLADLVEFSSEGIYDTIFSFCKNNFTIRTRLKLAKIEERFKIKLGLRLDNYEKYIFHTLHVQ